MKIKIISDEEWDALYVKPLIFIGFHCCNMGIIVVVIGDESVWECRVIDDSHVARQAAFAAIHKHYCDAPLVVFNKKTENYLVEILAQKLSPKESLKLMLKGPATKIRQWERELTNFLKNKGEKVSADNPIQLPLLWN
ncbi:MAG: hypothetical protein LBG09_03630 [Puniceicoccales bacterium]|jgi:hypothetical protein|nr:hypothetical protein [Puniceicoccales bacterium]